MTVFLFEYMGSVFFWLKEFQEKRLCSYSVARPFLQNLTVLFACAYNIKIWAKNK